MENLPKNCGNLFLHLEISKKINRLVLKLETEIWFFSFGEISFFQVNTNLAIVVFFIKNQRIWFQYSQEEKGAFLNLLDKVKYKLASRYNYVKIEECDYLEEETSTLFLKGGYKINGAFKAKTIIEQFKLPKIKLKKFNKEEYYERNSVNSGG
jgi:hypothetical protein